MSSHADSRAHPLPEVTGRRALVYSMGMEGRDLARWLIRNGAFVTMSDTRTEGQLRAAGAYAPEGTERAVTGEPLLDPAGFDVLAVSQSILRHDPAIRRARELKIPVVSQAQLFLRLCPGPVIGITGSSGKSTTTALVGAMAREARVRYVVGGNIGTPLLESLDDIDGATTVIFEISHTQLQYTDASPHVAAITNVTPNHLDQFSWEEYVELKRHILAFQGGEDVAVLNADDPVSARFRAAVRGRLVIASVSGPWGGDGAWLEDGWLVVRAGGQTRRVIDRREVRLRGEHNVANVVMACAIGAAAGFDPETMARAIASFRGIPHRLEPAGSVAGATWVNDSIATTPERTVAGLRAFTEPVVLLLGGREKKLPLDALRVEARGRCRAVVCFGEAAATFAEGVAHPQTTVVETLEDAVAAAAGLAQPGDIVLLSPAGTSFDAFASFEARGARFRELVAALPGYEPEEVSP
ncbi:MAG: UDP-N-acetylmuramoyl-L-alanine--D-glutamate ligase [Dehalococcoidia bacterium]